MLFYQGAQIVTFQRRIYFSGLIIALLGLYARAALADLSVDKAIIDFDQSSDYYQDLHVFNDGKERMYVSVVASEIVNPGTDKEERVALTDPDKASLVATPSRLILEPNVRRSVRLLNLDESLKKERIYRVLISQETGELKSDQTAIKVLFAYDVLVIVRPEKPTHVVLSERRNQSLTLQNTGNTNVFIRDGKQCNPKDPKECRDLPEKRLYAGSLWTQELPWAAPVRYKVDNGNSYPEVVFDGNDKLDR